MSDPMMLGPYDYSEVLSAFRKSIKLDRPTEAIYWLNALLTYGPKGAKTTAAKQLWIMAAEDIDDPLIMLRAAAVIQLANVVEETDHLFFLTAAMCKARKWWEHEEGREVDRLWSQAIGDLKVPERRREIPSYALDRHTRRGWELRRAGQHFDDRFSGTDMGRLKTCYLFERDGEITPDSVIDEGFWRVWRERRALEAKEAPEPDERGVVQPRLDESDR